MKNLFGKFGGLVLTTALAIAFLAPIGAQAQQSMGDSPGVFNLVAANTITNANSSSATFTNTGVGQGNAYLVLSGTNAFGTTPTLTCTLQSSTDNSTWTTLSPNVAVTTNYPTTGVGVLAMSLVGPIQNYAYLRTTNVISGTTASYNYSLSLVYPKQYK